MINGKRIAVVLPAYNAEKTLEATVQELPDLVDACILVDAALSGSAPGTVSCIEPEICDQPRSIGMHEQEPSRVLALAKALGVLPEKVLLIGCEPEEIEDLKEELSLPVAAAVEPAVQRILHEVRLLNGF